MALDKITITVRPMSRLINSAMCTVVAQTVAIRKGWNDDHLRAVIVDFVTTTDDVTLRDFLEAAE